jgi:hypothetical protein
VAVRFNEAWNENGVFEAVVLKEFTTGEPISHVASSSNVENFSFIYSDAVGARI